MKLIGPGLNPWPFHVGFAVVVPAMTPDAANVGGIPSVPEFPKWFMCPEWDRSRIDEVFKQQGLHEVAWLEVDLDEPIVEGPPNETV